MPLKTELTNEGKAASLHHLSIRFSTFQYTAINIATAVALAVLVCFVVTLFDATQESNMVKLY